MIEYELENCVPLIIALLILADTPSLLYVGLLIVIENDSPPLIVPEPYLSVLGFVEYHGPEPLYPKILGVSETDIVYSLALSSVNEAVTVQSAASNRPDCTVIAKFKTKNKTIINALITHDFSGPSHDLGYPWIHCAAGMSKGPSYHLIELESACDTDLKIEVWYYLRSNYPDKTGHDINDWIITDNPAIYIIPAGSTSFNFTMNGDGYMWTDLFKSYSWHDYIWEEDGYCYICIAGVNITNTSSLYKIKYKFLDPSDGGGSWNESMTE